MHALDEYLSFTPEHFLALVEREQQEFEQLMDMIQDRHQCDRNHVAVNALPRFTLYLRTWELRN